jgi:hypothetical protein
MGERGRNDGTGRVDAARECRNSPHSTLGGRDHGVLEVDTAEVDGDEKVAFVTGDRLHVVHAHGELVVDLTDYERPHRSTVRADE